MPIAQSIFGLAEQESWFVRDCPQYNDLVSFIGLAESHGENFHRNKDDDSEDAQEYGFQEAPSQKCSPSFKALEMFRIDQDVVALESCNTGCYGNWSG